MISDFDIILVM